MKKCTVGFIGGGKMATAIMKGIAASGVVPAGKIAVTDISGAVLEHHASGGFVTTRDTGALIANCKYIFFAVKPQVIDDVMAEIKSLFTSEQVAISIVAGRGEAYFKEALGPGCKLVLAMPNTPLMLGYGATALSPIPPVAVEEFRFVRSMFESAGIVEEIDPALMNKCIPVHSSSPAFIYLFAKAVVEQSVKNGIDAGVAGRLFCQTLIGAARMMTGGGKTYDELIDMVCSPNGTTIAAVDHLNSRDFTGIVTEAMQVCTGRAYELAGESGR